MSTRTTIGIERFGRDHWSTLAYIETRNVDGGKRIEHIRMRCDRDRHPLAAHMPRAVDTKHPTRLNDGELLSNHDDWDCIDDMEAAGLVTIHGTGIAPLVKLTDRGWQISAALRKHIASKPSTGSAYETFDFRAAGSR